MLRGVYKCIRDFFSIPHFLTLQTNLVTIGIFCILLCRSINITSVETVIASLLRPSCDIKAICESDFRVAFELTACLVQTQEHT